MENLEEKTVAEIVSKNIKTADVFKKNGIDFCCGGNINVQEVCEKNGVNFNLLKEEIISVDNILSDTNDYNSWELDFLAEYILNTHHKYVVEANDLIVQYAEKVAKVHGHHYTEVIEINELFYTLANELKMHMHKEEMMLFPYIKELAVAKRNNTEMPPCPFGTIQNPINMMELEHVDAGNVIKKIAELSNNFNPPKEACNTFRALYAKLEEYQNDLFQHIHLENNILFPKAIQLEKE